MKKWALRILRPIAMVPTVLIIFRGLMQPTVEVCAIAIRRRWPDAWFSSSIVLNADFLALAFSSVLALIIIQHVSSRYLNLN
jgi:xanthine/uracil permease